MRPAQIVVVEHPDGSDGSYRAAPAADPPSTCTVVSDNHGYRNDSRRFGFIACDRVLGVVAQAPHIGLVHPVRVPYKRAHGAH